MPEDVDVSLENIACRILVISHTAALAQSCIYRIQNRGHTLPSTPSTEKLDMSTSASDVSGSSSDSVKIPWTITNKYYSAPVHFATHTVHGLSPHQVRNVPAIVFVWSQGESYKRQIERIAQDLSGYEPEVCLAIKTTSQTPPLPPHAADEDEQNEEDGEIDAFLTSYGFEYIDATEEQAPEDIGNLSESGPWSEGIPGLLRVVDALSTIMWPSMQTITNGPPSSSRNRDREHTLLDWAHQSHDSGLSAIDGDDASTQPSVRTRSMKREMEELARWLEDDEYLHDNPWKSAASSSEMTASPSSIHEDSQAKASVMGFDDDFTVFISAPAIGGPTETSGSSSPDLTTVGLSPASAIPHDRPFYRSLGSVSDFGDSDDGKDDDSAEDELPTKDEILATTSRIFGPAKVNAKADKLRFGPIDDSSPFNAATSKDNADVESVTSGDGGGEQNGSYDMEPFDLSKVVNALHEMKAEIASMEDEGERRRTAAKVALGLVYGLESDAHVL